MRKIILFLGLLFLLSANAVLAANSTISGVVTNVDGTVCSLCTVGFNSLVTQTISGVAYQPKFVTTTTDGNGNLAPITLPQGLAVQVTVSEGGTTFPAITAIIPFLSAATFNQLNQGILSNPLNVLASQQPPTGPLSMNSQKITNLACPSNSGDALAWGCNATVNNLTVTGGFTQNTSGAGFFGLLTVSAIANPAAPSAVVAVGTTGATTYYYFVVCHDGNGGTTLASTGTVVSNANAALSGSNYDNVAFTIPAHAQNCDILRNTTNTTTGAQSCTGGLAVTASPFLDQSNTTNAYVIPTRNTTGDGQFAGNVSATNVSGTSTVSAPSITGTTIAGAVNGEISVTAAPYNAKCDGVTDDTAAIQSAITAAETTNSVPSILIPWTGHNCLVSQLNLTNLPNGFRIRGQNSPKANKSTTIPATSGLSCQEMVINTGVCIDTSGSWYWSLENLSVLGNGTKPPNILLLLAKTTAATGNSQAGTIQNVDLFNNGPYTIYNYGGEVFTARDSSIGGGATADVVISVANTAGITSPFATLVTAPTSMTVGSYRDDIFTCVTGSSCILFDIGSGGSVGQIANQTFDGGYVSQTSAGAFNATGTSSNPGLSGLTIENMRLEPMGGVATQYFFKSAVQVENFAFINDTFANTVQPSVAEIQFNQTSILSAAGGYINLRPGDSQAVYPTGNVITCAGTVAGVLFQSVDASGGVILPTSCTGLTTLYQGISIPHGIQVFSTNGTFTVPTNVTSFIVECWGGGGGGGGYGTASTNGGNGGDVSVVGPSSTTVCQAQHGSGGTGVASGSLGAGGIPGNSGAGGTVGTVKISGGYGFAGNVNNGTVGGFGGGSPRGNAAPSPGGGDAFGGGGNGAGPGNATLGAGGGGSGGYSEAQVSTTPATAYTVTVGTAGGGGTGGTGNGASGDVGGVVVTW